MYYFWAPPGYPVVYQKFTMKVAVVGATGLVGNVMMRLLAERGFPVSELIPVASPSSAGSTVEFNGKNHTVVTCEDARSKKPDLALFSAGGDTSRMWAPRFAEAGCRVIDNSSAWRMDPACPLIVPEVNADALQQDHYIIANPNCSTIQLVVALHPLHERYSIDRLVISTYQSVTGTGKKAVDQLENERAGRAGELAYPYPIDRNCLPHCDVFLDNDYTREEMKLVNETRKILGEEGLRITATAVRVPVVGGHSESVNASFHQSIDLADIRKVLKNAPGITLQDNPTVNLYPMPAMAEGKDEVFVGRLRLDESQSNTLNMWVVSDNLRKGAATNAIQIAEYLVNKEWL